MRPNLDCLRANRITYVVMVTTIFGLLPACDDGTGSNAADALLDAHLMEIGVLDAAPDGSVTDAAARPDRYIVDQAIVDSRPPDAAPDKGPPQDPYVASGVFERIPGPACATPQAPSDDMPGDFEAWNFEDLGRLQYAGDVNGNGRAELFVYTDFLSEEPEHGYRGVTIYERDEEGAWAVLGHARSIIPYGFADLDGDGRNELIGGEHYLSSLGMSSDGDTILGYSYTFSARADERGEGVWRYDQDVVDYVYETSPGEWNHEVPGVVRRNLFTMEVIDLDQDGRPEVHLNEHNVLIEWTGDDFVRVFDPADPVFGAGGSTGPSAFGDFDGDGQLEMALPTFGPKVFLESGSFYLDEHYRILENRGDDTYVDTQRLAIGRRSGRGAAAGDINGDGIDDLLVAAGPGGCTRYQLWSTDGDDHLRLLWEYDHQYMDRATNVHPLKFGDIDGDGDQEAVINMGLIMTIWDWRLDAASASGGTMVQIFGERITRPQVGLGPVFAEDLDGDGAAEILFVDTVGGAAVGGGPEDWLNPRGVLIHSLRR